MTDDERLEIDRLIRRLAAMGAVRGAEGGLAPTTRDALAALGPERLRDMVGGLERAIAHANAKRRVPDDGGAGRALRRLRVQDALDRLNGLADRIRARRGRE